MSPEYTGSIHQGQSTNQVHKAGKQTRKIGCHVYVVHVLNTSTGDTLRTQLHACPSCFFFKNNWIRPRHRLDTSKTRPGHVSGKKKKTNPTHRRSSSSSSSLRKDRRPDLNPFCDSPFYPFCLVTFVPFALLFYPFMLRLVISPFCPFFFVRVCLG